MVLGKAFLEETFCEVIRVNKDALGIFEQFLQSYKNTVENLVRYLTAHGSTVAQLL